MTSISRCTVSGWGKDMFGTQGQYQQILKKVDVPIVAPATCQTQLQTARLGSTYVLDTTSFICAGGEPNKDACTVSCVNTKVFKILLIFSHTYNTLWFSPLFILWMTSGSAKGLNYVK